MPVAGWARPEPLPAEQDITSTRRAVPVRESATPPGSPLTVAGAEWVGEARVPETPWIPSAFLHNAYREKDRMLASAYVEENGEAPFVPVARSAPPPPPVVTTPQAPVARPRRASLAESRRRGISVTTPAGDRTADQTAPADRAEPHRPATSPTDAHAPPVERDRPPDPPASVQLAPLDQAPLDSPVPQAIAVPLSRALGVDVSAIPVRRGGFVADAARRLRARAFTAGGVVHIPDRFGALDGRGAASLLAHELTHAVQQQRFGTALPSAGSALGRQLESEAVAVEKWVRDGAVPLAPRQLRPDKPDEPDDPEGWHDLPEVDAGSLLDEFEKATGTQVTADAEDHELPDVSADGLMAAYRDFQRLADEQDAAEQDGPTATTTTEPATSSADDLVDRIADNPPRRWLDLDDPDNFEEIANRLYHHLVGRLRFDVLVERERSGTLLDFS